MALPQVDQANYPTVSELRGALLRTIVLGYARRGIAANVLPGSDHYIRHDSIAKRAAIAFANLEATIHRSVELGIHHIETARGYGSSEMQLAPVLKQRLAAERQRQAAVAVLESRRVELEDQLRAFQRGLEEAREAWREMLSAGSVGAADIRGAGMQAVASLVLFAAVVAGAATWIGGFAAGVHAPLERCFSGVAS